MKYLLLFTTMLFAGELEVDGNLKVTGTVDASGNPITNVGAALSMTDAINGNVLQSALRDDGTYEYLAYKIKIQPTSENRLMDWIMLSESGDDNWNNNFVIELNSRALEGYEIHNIINLPYFYPYGNDEGPTTDNHAYTLIIFRRPIEE